MQVQEVTDSDSKDFTLNNDSTVFSGRCKDVFGSLQSLESKHKEFETTQSSERYTTLFKSEPIIDDIIQTDSQKHHSDSKQQRDHIVPCRQSSSSKNESKRSDDHFKSPNDLRHKLKSRGDDRKYSDPKSSSTHSTSRRHNEHFRPAPFCRRPYHRPQHRQSVPDHRVNPQNWKRYSLEDTSDVSDSSNSKAAFAFLEERKKLREEQEGCIAEKVDVQESACSKGFLTFKRPTNKSSSKSDDLKNMNKKIKSDQLDNEECESVEINKEEICVKTSSSSESSSVKFGKKNKGSKNIRKRTWEEPEDSEDM